MRRPILQFFALLLVLAPAAARADCGWADGQDPRGPSNDPGRGVSDWAQHYAYANGAAGAANVPGLVAARFEALRSCLPGERFARAYADASVLIAYYGRTHAGWLDSMDSRASNDPGRGIARWRPHFDYGANGSLTSNVPGFMRTRLSDLRGPLSQQVYARLYADLSIMIARYARMP